MNLAHLHLLLNHFPTIGTIIGLTLFLVSLLGKSEDLKRASMVIFLGIALITIPTYVTGSAAQEILKNSPGINGKVASAPWRKPSSVAPGAGSIMLEVLMEIRLRREAIAQLSAAVKRQNRTPAMRRALVRAQASEFE